ncbi:MAG: tRNA (N6-threonylcarbamoyladenosine(37)-N6)-methyltransferase TrmO [Polyangiaceae bacterium]
MSDSERKTLTLRPIGVAHTPFREKVEAPRQGIVAKDVEATIEIFDEPGMRDALSDLEEWKRLWLLFWFDRNEGWKPKVRPPRSDTKKGLFATRSPHRPNSIGMSAVRLVRVDGLKIIVTDIDLLDQTPIFDIKPYVPYADAFPDEDSGWLVPDPKPEFAVTWTADAEAQLAWLLTNGVDIRQGVEDILKLGPMPHAYRRIRKERDKAVLAHKEWRVDFNADDKSITIFRIRSGYKHKELPQAPPPHALFCETFGV